MDQAVAIATTLASQLDVATQQIKQLKAELRESRAYATSLNEQLQKQQQQTITAKDIIAEMLADAAEKYAETMAYEDYHSMMVFQRKYDSM